MSKLWYDAPGGFFCLPRALRHDDRLSHPDIRVLLALASYVFQKDGVFPSRESLHKLTGIETTNISKRTARLAQFGWLSKSGKPGQRMTYTLMVPAYAANRMNEAKLKAAPESINAPYSPKLILPVNASPIQQVLDAEEDMLEWGDIE